MSKTYCVKAMFYDKNEKRVATAFLSMDMFKHSIFCSDPLLDRNCFRTKSVELAMKVRNKMDVSNYIYFDPIGKNTYKVKWGIHEIEV